MALVGWRLSKRRYAEAAFSGEGPRLYGGRWNSPGTPLVYTSLSLSLAVLEVFVHMDPITQPEDYVSVSVELDVTASQAERISPERLPSDWTIIDHPMLKDVGDIWVRSMRSAVLLVPSAVVEGEWNALVNPLHPASRQMKRSAPKTYHFDQRMFCRRT